MNTVRLNAHVIMLLLLLVCSSWETNLKSTHSANGRFIKWVVEKNSTLSVAGKSNVNQFNCSITGYYQADTIICSEEASGKPVLLNGCLELDISRFDCNSRIITTDLRKTLRAEIHPQMIIRFLTLEQMPVLQGKAQSLKGWVEVGIAGTKKTFQIEYDFIKQDQASFLLNGHKTFCFSDFKLSPPKKLAGMIQIKDAFDVVFQLRMRIIK